MKRYKAALFVFAAILFIFCFRLFYQNLQKGSEGLRDSRKPVENDSNYDKGSNLLSPLEDKLDLNQVDKTDTVSNEVTYNNGKLISGNNVKDENKPQHIKTTTNTVSDNRSHEMEKEKYVRLAFEGARKVMEINDFSNAKIEYESNVVIVTFPFPCKTDSSRPPPPGPDYLARVKFNRQTGQIIEILGAQ